ncbi:hypothetical protein HPB49_023657 [Dermacentor silvarum]|uniref:Uncharacterized protein n=2 Tax=Dermacentor silvarum TaxID=543639 RepID=A0ACB8DG15_DERSI|nr:hypothetical protein HPB49_023657 [Dermacentor silvarum]
MLQCPKPIPPKKRKKRKSSGTNTSMHSAWLFSRKKRVKRPPKKKQPQKSSSQPAEPSVAVETEVVNSHKAADSMCSRLEGVGSTKKKPPVATVGEVEATSDKVILKGINQKPSYAAAADQAVEDSKFHTTKPLQLSTAPYAKTTSFLQEAMLDLDMFTGLNILDVCGSHTENLKDLKARITNRSITKNEAVAEIAQSVHTAVVEEYFKRERAVRTLNLLARIPFSLDPLEVPKIRNVTQSIVEQSQVRAKVEPGE